MGKDYEPWQLKRIREGVKAYRALGIGDDLGAADIPWNSIVIAIKDLTGVELSESSLSKFVIGVPHRDEEKKAQGIRQYPKTRDEWLDAIIEFLANPDSPGFIFHREDLDIYSSDIVGPLRFMEFLDGNREEGSIIPPKAFAGVFSTIRQDKGTATLCLRFRDASHNGLIQFLLLKHTSNDFLMPELRMDEFEHRLDSGDSLERYRGWAILTPEETMLFAARSDLNGDAMMYFMLGVDNAVYRNKAAAIVLLEYAYPEDTIDVSVKGGTDGLREAVIQSWEQKIFLFNRVPDEILDTAITGD